MAEPQELNQAGAAALMDVDRTTIRAWTNAGMPYTAPDERGKEGGYRRGVLLHWVLWRGLRDALKLSDLPPLRALAVARATLIDSQSSEDEFRQFFPSLVAGYFSTAEIHEAMGFALAYIEGLRRATR